MLNKKSGFKNDSQFLQPMHHKDVQFILKGLCHLIRKFQFEVLNKCKAICIIADEWSDDASQEYCSVSARYVMDNLDEGIIFLGFFQIRKYSCINNC